MYTSGHCVPVAPAAVLFASGLQPPANRTGAFVVPFPTMVWFRQMESAQPGRRADTSTGQPMPRSLWPCWPLLLAALVQPVAALELQGHRGARGLWPENTLPAFAGALAIGVHVLELDLALTADDVVVVSHDPVLDPDITRGPDGNWLQPPAPVIRSLTLEQLRAYDVGRSRPGSRHALRFRQVRAVDGTPIPTLDEVFELTRRAGACSVRFNIETKVEPGAGASYPDAAHFTRRVVETVRKAGMSGRVTLQSFDWRTLAEARRIAPDIALLALTVEQDWLDNVQRGRPGASPWTAGLDVDEHGGSVPRMVAASGAGTWSPNWRNVDAASLAEAQALGLRVVVWTVNETRDMHIMIRLGVDGIVTDYPDRLREVMRQRGLPLPPSFTLAGE